MKLHLGSSTIDSLHIYNYNIGGHCHFTLANLAHSHTKWAKTEISTTGITLINPDSLAQSIDFILFFSDWSS